MHAEEIGGCSHEVVTVRLMGLKRQAAKVRRAAGDKQVKNWPDAVRRSALALLHDEVSPIEIAEAVGVTVQTIGNWRKAEESVHRVRELRIVPTGSGEMYPEPTHSAEPVRIRLGGAVEVLIPAGEFRAEWLVALSQAVKS